MPDSRVTLETRRNMKNFTKVILLTALAVFLANTSAISTTIKIDGSFDRTNEWAGYFTDDDGIVGPGGGGQAYDTEFLGLYFDSDTVYFGLQTGFDLRYGRTYHGKKIVPGDLSLDVNGNGTYDYAIDFSIAYNDVITYSLIDMTEKDSKWGDVIYSSHYAEGNPLEAISGNVLSTFAGAFSADNNDRYGHTHSDVIEGFFDIGLLSAYTGESMKFHWTMGCGNDVIEAKASFLPIPEPATMLLLGSGLLSLAAISRKRRLW